MNILLTNDDGYNAEGILLLKELLSKYGNVVIVAPKHAMSAMSCAITIGKPLVLKEEEKGIFSFTGTPADCVAFGLSSLNIDFDLVVSGCNNGANISYDTIYSGTIGAGLETLTFNKPAIAISTKYGEFGNVKKYFDVVWKYINDHQLISKEYLLNINFPKVDYKGIKLASEYYRKDCDYFTKTKEGYFAYRTCQTDFSDQKSSDCYLIENGYVTITPLSKTYYSKELLDKISKKI